MAKVKCGKLDLDRACDVGVFARRAVVPKAEVRTVPGWKMPDSNKRPVATLQAAPTAQSFDQLLTPKQFLSQDCLRDVVVGRPRARSEHPDVATSRGAVPLPGLTELEASQVVSERWTCFPDLPTQLRPSRQSALRLHKALMQPQADMEIDLVGSVDAPSRKVLLMWCLGCCLELLGLLDPAAALFAKCTAADVGNPVHAYNRGVVLLRLNQWQAASRDFDLAASHCLARGPLLPVMLLVRRAFANLRLQRIPEVWADFELARLRTFYPTLSLSQLQRQLAKEDINSYASYCRALTSPARLPAHRHWLVQLAGQKLQDTTKGIQSCVLELLHGIPGLAHLKLTAIPWETVSVVLLRQGQPLLPTYSNIFALISGELQAMRFTPKAVPEDMVAAFLEEESLWSAPSTFCGPPGRQQDGWLVASSKGATLLQITMEGMQCMS